MNAPLSVRGLAWSLPWFAALAVWGLVVQPIRSEGEARLIEQSRIRRDRLKADRAARQAFALSERVRNALGSSCRAADDPASLRRRVVAAMAGLELSPVRLSVTGGPSGGAAIEAEGPRASVEELLRRLGARERGGFLRSVNLSRTRGAIWVASVTTGLLGSLPPNLGKVGVCAEPSDPQPAPRIEASGPRPRIRPTSPPVPVRVEPTPPSIAPAREEAPPFTLVAFLRSEGKSRVSVRLGGEVRVISAGEQVDGWTCVSIDPDEGAVFASPDKPRVVLKAGPGR